MNLAYLRRPKQTAFRGHMLAKIEDAYLNFLRLAILIVAGLALVAAAGGLVFGAIKAGQGFFASDMDARGRNLGEFIIEKRLAAEQSDAPQVSAAPKAADPVTLFGGTPGNSGLM